VLSAVRKPPGLECDRRTRARILPGQEPTPPPTTRSRPLIGASGRPNRAHPTVRRGQSSSTAVSRTSTTIATCPVHDIDTLEAIVAARAYGDIKFNHAMSLDSPTMCSFKRTVRQRPRLAVGLPQGLRHLPNWPIRCRTKPGSSITSSPEASRQAYKPAPPVRHVGRDSETTSYPDFPVLQESHGLQKYRPGGDAPLAPNVELELLIVWLLRVVCAPLYGPPPYQIPHLLCPSTKTATTGLSSRAGSKRPCRLGCSRPDRGALSTPTPLPSLATRAFRSRGRVPWVVDGEAGGDRPVEAQP